LRQLAAAFLAGLLALARRTPLWAGLFVFLVVLLTTVTQIGGVVLLLCIPAFAWVGRRLAERIQLIRVGACIGVYACVYLAASLAVVPLAGAFGRAPLPCGVAGEVTLAPRTFLTCLLNRHYSALPARQALQKINNEFSAEYRGFRVAYLDAGFPFFDGFPMMPHLSHGDGRKIDLALIYPDGSATPSPIGYWGFAQPRQGDPQPCAGQTGLLRWNMTWLQPLLPGKELDAPHTAALVKALARSPAVSRIFLEPHLRRRLALDHPKIRFQGCAAARHDDHIHVEFVAGQ
jgi:hypothetical protein